ncbi:WD40-repeat-containing domain protein [Neohortaea acidophila]|uniref:WD40-repeat-containing domain protein n=1 Tax=Neohortaea acidophila TaxID=245834 RepID=A0A6A6Q285_9PEZI|nr:WD40-repeat-containing domain protein [Neohortaea acidophila]KAF2486510.1 WD40-repeat-containing domain protein [Neohortaea acidophila]
MQHERQHVPVTALALVGDDWIFSGQGPYLYIYGSDGTTHRKIRVFEGQAIHGIALSADDLASAALIWGGSLSRSLSIDIQDGRIEASLGPVQNVQDWILDAAFAPSSHSLIGLVTAHNALATISITRPAHAKSPTPRPSLQQRVPGSNCILYSAHILWLSPSHCLVASGTAFGDIIVWSAYLEHDSEVPLRSHTHFTFAAHEGSVFGVRLSSQLKIPGFGCERVLASCSDDRTVRIWDVSSLPMESSAAGETPRDTGFGAKISEDALAPRCLAKAMGHISRIWHVRYAAGKHRDETMRILSFGEDASVIVWALQAREQLCSLNQLRSIKAHSGKNIWAVAVHDSRGLLATGAADGAIALYESPGKSLDIHEIAPPLSLESKGSDAYRTYGFVGPSTVLATTDRGGVVQFHLSGDQPLHPIEISSPLASLRGYSIMSNVSAFGFIGGSDGAIHAFDRGTAQLVGLAQVGSKVAGLFACRPRSDLLNLLATTVNATEARILRLDGPDPFRSPSRTTMLQLPESFVVTSFAYYEDESLRYAVLGSRGGAIAVYCPSVDGSNQLDCSITISEAHNAESVTSLRLVQQKRTPGHAARHFLFSTGRDGTFAVRELRHSNAAVEVITLHQLALPFGPNIEGLKMHADDSRVWTWGFQSKHFVVYDVMAQREIMRVECGGAHRQWAFEPDFDANGGRFVWTKAGRLFHAQQAALPFRLLNEGGHGREIKAVAVSSASAEIGSVIATGAEDTDIKLFRYEKSGGFHCLQTLRKHNTGVQHLAWHGNYLLSSGGFEEFFVWRVSAGVPYLGIGVACESAHPRSGASDLRIMGFCVDEDTRDGNRGLRITMAYSDSTLKVWAYESEQRTWTLISAGDYLTSCLTQVMATTDHRFITAATDGYLTTWRHQQQQQQSLDWLSRHNVHQSAIHTIAHLELADGTSLFVTGGDDNAIAITRCTPGESSDDTGMATLLIPRAHAAAVTGVAIISIRPNGGECQQVQLVSAGIDQRIKVWEVEVDAVGAMRVKKVADVFTAVADVSGLEVWRGEEDGVSGVLVSGVGIDLWRMPSASA